MSQCPAVGTGMVFIHPLSGAQTDTRRHSMEQDRKRGLMVSSRWGQAIVIVFIFGFFVMGLLAYRTYTSEPPIPGKVVDSSGQLLFTRADITRGQETFLRNGLMEYGSIFGHGAYLGPDFTADYLHRAAMIVRSIYANSGSDRAQAQTIEDFRSNRYDPASGVLVYTTAQSTAFDRLQSYYQDYFGTPTTEHGLRPQAISNPRHIHE